MLRRATRVFADETGELTHILDRLERQARQLYRRARRNDGASETQLHGLFEAQLRLRRGAHIARKADFAEEHAIPRQGPPAERRKKRRGRRKIRPRFAHFQAAGNVQIDIVGADAKARAGVEEE